MVDPGREPPASLAEADEASIPFRTKDEPVAAEPARAHEGEPLIAGAVEIAGKGPARARPGVIGDCSGESLGGFVAAAAAGGGTVVSDGRSGHATLEDVKHDPEAVGPMAGHVVPPPVRRVFANTEQPGVTHEISRRSA